MSESFGRIGAGMSEVASVFNNLKSSREGQRRDRLRNVLVNLTNGGEGAHLAAWESLV